MRAHLFSIPLLLSACAPTTTGVQGGVLVAYSQFTRKAERVYTAGTCRDRAGAPVSAPEEVEYELHRDGKRPEFLEHALSEDNARLLNNRWEDRAGTHYFVWLKDVRGFEYLLPADPSRSAQRLIYRSPQVRAVKRDGQVSMQPLGQPDVVCELLAMR